MLGSFLVRILQYFLNEKLKKTPSKVVQKHSNIFFLLHWAAQTEEFIFQNVAYRPTVYKTGCVEGMLLQ